jgi:dTDP-4-amino-4,6-dideoxygalactose transaminase
MDRVKFNVPTIVGDEIKNILQVLNAEHWSGDGYFTKKCHEFLEQSLGVRKVLLTTSCTHALELSAMLLDINPGDEVIVPSFTFVSTINAFVLRGAHPVFIDIKPDTLNLDESLLEGLITNRTKAILPVHYAGVGCEMDVIMSISNRYNIQVVEDNAHGLFGKYKGKFLGTFGVLATQSFHETKNFTCGEGGALLINATSYIERAEIIREKGTNRSRFFRGQVDKYSWVDIGSSYLPSEILAAILFSQLQSHDLIQSKRKQIWEYYYSNLKDWAIENNVGLPFIPPDCDQAYHIFYMLLPSLDQRQGLISHLHERGIQSVFHYLPLHLSEMGKRFGGKEGDCPVTENISNRLLRLPFYYNLSEEDQKFIIAEIKQFRFNQN